MFTRVMLSCLFAASLAALAAAPVPPEPPKKSIECKGEGQYIGGIDRHYTLQVSGPKEKTWKYTFRTSPQGVGEFEASGTYEQVEDLAVFTGKVKRGGKEAETQFAYNYGFVGEEVAFNGFFPADDKTLRWRSQKFVKAGDKWELSEEINLTTSRDLPAGKEWKLEIKGQKKVRGKDGKVTVTEVNTTATYAEQGPKVYLRTPPQAANDGLPYTFRVVGDKKLDAILFTGDGGTGGVLRGFRPMVPQDGE